MTSLKLLDLLKSRCYSITIEEPEWFGSEKQEQGTVMKNSIEMNVDGEIEQAVQGLVSRLKGIFEGSAQELIRSKLAAVFGEVQPVIRTVNATKRNYQRKPCPVPGCNELAAPRYHQICVEHGKEFNAAGHAGEKRRDAVIAAARAPGGVWYQEAREKKKPGRKPAGTSAAT